MIVIPSLSWRRKSQNRKIKNGSNYGGDLVVLDANVHIASVENGEAETKKVKKSRRKRKEIPSFTWKKREKPH